MNTEEMRLGDFNPLVVHTIDPKTKKVLKVNPFRLIIAKGQRFYEWPKGSSNLWFENREPAGRLSEKGEPITGAEHIVWNPPVTMDATVGQANKVLEQENKKLMAELASIKQEREMDAVIAKAKPDAKPKPNVKEK